MRSRFVPALIALVAVVGITSCGSDSKDADAPSSATTTTLPPELAAQAFTKRGPHPVGVTTLELDGGVKVEVWYPAPPGTTGEDSYDLRKIVPQAVTDLLTADVPAIYTTQAKRDADVAEGTFPLVLFSHGATGIRQQSTFLTAHLASWGMIVAAPDHWTRDMYHTLDRVLGAKAVEANDSVEDLRLTRELMESENEAADSRFNGRIDTEQVGAVGHSAGGGSVLGFAKESGVDGYVTMASGVLSGASTSTTAPVAPPTLPDLPSLFMAGSLDKITDPTTVTRKAYDAAPPPSTLWIIEGAGHNAFDDFCTLGDGSGIIGVAVASGLGPFLDAQPQLRRLGEDGCLDPAVPVEDTFPIVQHAVTSWLRSLFGLDPAPVGLGPEVEGEYSVPVEITQKP